MARIRTIKPEFWQDEDLAGVSESACLMAIGLLNHADDEGYFKAHPGLIRAAIFPLREPSVTIHGMISELSMIGYIEVRKGKDGKEYGKVVKFQQHQKVNRPQASKIKDLFEFSEHSVNDHGTLTAGKEQGKEQGKEDIAGVETPLESPPRREPCPYQKIIDLYHEKLPMLPQVVKLTESRKRAINARWRNGMYGLGNWDKYFDDVAKSKFLTGRSDPRPAVGNGAPTSIF